jgi:hypothetical protein
MYRWPAGNQLVIPLIESANHMKIPFSRSTCFVVIVKIWAAQSRIACTTMLI